jgi:phospholipid/cholesterol/gamma-HCH transport system substrate-binding protein
MERNANYALVGAASLALFVGLIVFIVWLARIQFAHEYTDYQVLFIGPVRGLSEGGEVHFNGIKVGEVKTIGLDETDPKRVIALVKLLSKVPIRVDSYASLEPQGITGVNYIQITAGTATKPLLKDVTPRGKLPVIQTRSSALSDLLEGSGTVLNATVDALNRVNRILSDDNIKTLTATMHDVQAVTAEARKRKELLADADATIKSIDQTAQSIKQLSDSSNALVNGDGKRTLKEASEAAAEIKAAAVDTRAMVAKLQGPTSDFATTGLPQLTSAIVTLQQAANSLNRLVSEAEQSPRSLVAKPPAKEVEVKP